MSRRLRTSPGRLLRAAMLGFLTPVALLYLFMAFTGPRSADLDDFRTGAVVVSVFMVPGAIAWGVMHRLGARLPWAVALGATLGALEGLLMASLGRENVSSHVLPLFNAVFLAGFGGIGALVTAIVWLVAYPRKLQASVSETFA